ncbi:MAG: hypothetical protein RIC35_10825 [Marinoscillum sp.]
MMVSEGEYLFIYNSNMIQDKTARGYALSIDHIKLNERDIHKDHLTPMQIAEIADMLKVSISDLYKQSQSSSHEHYTDDELVRILSYDPTKLKTPIILSPEVSFIVGSSYELIKEQLGNTNSK